MVWYGLGFVVVLGVWVVCVVGRVDIMLYTRNGCMKVATVGDLTKCNYTSKILTRQGCVTGGFLVAVEQTLKQYCFPFYQN